MAVAEERRYDRAHIFSAERVRDVAFRAYEVLKCTRGRWLVVEVVPSVVRHHERVDRRADLDDTDLLRQVSSAVHKVKEFAGGDGLTGLGAGLEAAVSGTEGVPSVVTHEIPELRPKQAHVVCHHGCAFDVGVKAEQAGRESIGAVGRQLLEETGGGGNAGGVEPSGLDVAQQPACVGRDRIRRQRDDLADAGPKPSCELQASELDWLGCAALA